MYCVCVTGSMGSGKSTVAQLFEAKGIELLSADRIAKALTHKDTPPYRAIVKHFGSRILHEDQTLNRALLRSIIFKHPNEKIWLESLLHPLIRKEIKQSATRCSSAYVVVEIPLLSDKKNYPYINYVLYIQAAKALKIARIINRDNCSKEQAMSILSQQPPESAYLALADAVINNDGSLSELKQEVNHFHDLFLTKAYQ